MSRQFFQPKTLEKALQLRKDHGNTSLLAGGTDIIVAIRKRKVPEGDIIDLSKINELKEIEIRGNEIRIGAMVTFSAIVDSKILKERANILCQAAETVGSPQIRNRGTIGGNLCNASAAADLVTPLVCFKAEIELQSLNSYNTNQRRRMPLENFIVGSKKVLIEKNEILTSIIFKALSSYMMTSFNKIGRRNALAIARVNGACALTIDNKKVKSLSFVLGAATLKPERFIVVENFLIGKKLNDKILKDAGNLASDYVLKQTSIRASSTYKLPVIAKFTISLIEEALKGGKINL